GTPASVSTDRIAGADALVRGSPSPVQAAPRPTQPNWQSPRPVQVAYARPPAPVLQRTIGSFRPGVWLQLASGNDAGDLAGRFHRLKAKNPDLFDGIKPYVANSADGARLVVGPFRGNSDADIFAEDLQSIGVAPMKWA